MLWILNANTHWRQRWTPWAKTRKNLSLNSLQVFTFSNLAVLVELSTLSSQDIASEKSLKKRCVKLVMKLADACRRTVGRRTNHAVEGEILNLFLVWTQWSAAEGHGGVKWWKTRTDEKEKRGQLNTDQKHGRHRLLKLKEQGVINEYSLGKDKYDLFLKDIFIPEGDSSVCTGWQVCRFYCSIDRSCSIKKKLRWSKNKFHICHKLWWGLYKQGSTYNRMSAAEWNITL